VNLFLDAFAWILDPANWEGRGSIPQRIGEQLYFTFAAMAVASAIAVPLGWLIGHTGRGRDIAVADIFDRGVAHGGELAGHREIPHIRRAGQVGHGRL